ncbi:MULTISPECIES: NUDIX domain-containing protein [unclassified Pseudofrankia]|uniref:NUDIX hydrolase n=1 Tax=unclassified Pseudofrankia TaxID=2994372 RepID=UPI0008D93B28|nr:MULTISPECIES: NUDIX domain-containing protein [unclassified Pseudofrankia]MDT3438838.1 NUDIX domain-containing protein [Pseudofrankia sp. BMG5.37]OHV75212.1 NUDIX hydrolase [Pseudofrankia sp. BMG5.36]
MSPATTRDEGGATEHGPPSTSVTVDVVLLTLRAGRLCVLVILRDEPPFQDYWALPGGFVGADEDLDSSARRQLAEETGVTTAGHLEQLYTYGDPGRDPRARVVSVAYLALLPNLPQPEPGRRGQQARWWPVEDLDSPEGPTLAFDHPRIVADGVERARSKLEYTPMAAAFCEEPFTLADLRRVYEAAWGVSLDPPNFRRKVLSTPDFVVPVGAVSSPRGGGRPAQLYRRGSATALYPPLLRRSV